VCSRFERSKPNSLKCHGPSANLGLVEILWRERFEFGARENQSHHHCLHHFYLQQSRSLGRTSPFGVLLDVQSCSWRSATIFPLSLLCPCVGFRHWKCGSLVVKTLGFWSPCRILSNGLSI
jgi:hypothetical protein